MNPPRSRDREEIEIRHLRLTGWIGLAGGLATLGRLRLLAAPPALVVALLWVFWLVVGLPTTQPGLDPQGDNFTVYYHVPDMLMATLIATLLMTLPLIAGRLRRSRSLAIK